MSESNSVTVCLRIRLTDGTQRIHELQLPATADGAKLLLQVDNGIKVILEKGRVLPLPNPPTYYPVEKIMWVESVVAEDKELHRKIEKRRIRFLKH